MSLDDYLRDFLAEAFLRIAPSRKAALSEAKNALSGEVKNILVIRQHDQLGDTLLALPALQALRGKFPSAHITFVASPYNAQVVRYSPSMNTLLIYDKSKMFFPWGLMGFLRQLRSRKWDVCFVLSTFCVSFTNALISYLARARFVIGYDTAFFHHPYSRAFYTTEVPFTEGGHETDVNLRLLAPFGIEPKEKFACLKTCEEDDLWARSFQSALATKKFVLLHPAGRRYPERFWPRERFSALAGRLAERGYTAVFFRGPGEADPCPDPLPPKWVRAENIGIGKFLSLAKAARLFIGNDAGTLHMASAVGAPCIALFTATDPKRWCPLSPSVRALKGEASAEKVLLMAMEILNDSAS